MGQKTIGILESLALVHRNDPDGLLVGFQADLVFLKSGRSSLLPRLSQPLQQLFDTQSTFQCCLVEQFTAVQHIGQPTFAARRGQQPAAHLLPRDQCRNHRHETFVAAKDHGTGRTSPASRPNRSHPVPAVPAQCPSHPEVPWPVAARTLPSLPGSAIASQDALQFQSLMRLENTFITVDHRGHTGILQSGLHVAGFVVGSHQNGNVMRAPAASPSTRALPLVPA